MAERLAILAGSGGLPKRLADAQREAGLTPFVLNLSGLADDWISSFPHERVGLGEPGKAVKILKREGCTSIVFAGIVKRPDFSGLKLDMKGMKLLPKVLAAARKGDDALLRVIVESFEAEGFRVSGADDVLGDSVAPAGVIAGREPSVEEKADIRRAAEIAAEIGRLDIGQGAIVCNGLVLAVEAQEGTDAMLRRCMHLPEEIRGRLDARRGVLVKRPKPGQETRIDLPTIGAATLEGVVSAGLAGIAVEAGAALMLDRERLEKIAASEGVFVYGFTPDDLVGGS